MQHHIWKAEDCVSEESIYCRIRSKTHILLFSRQHRDYCFRSKIDIVGFKAAQILLLLKPSGHCCSWSKMDMLFLKQKQLVMFCSANITGEYRQDFYYAETELLLYRDRYLLRRQNFCCADIGFVLCRRRNFVLRNHHVAAAIPQHTKMQRNRAMYIS